MFGFKKKPIPVPAPPKQSQAQAAKKELPGFPESELGKKSPESAQMTENLRPKPIFSILSQDLTGNEPKDPLQKIEALETEINGIEQVEKKITSKESQNEAELDSTIAKLQKLRDLIFKIAQKLEKLYIETNFDLEARMNIRKYQQETAARRQNLPKDILATQAGLYDAPDNMEERNQVHNANQRNPQDRSKA